MKNATFYLLDNDTHQDGLSAVEQLVCEIAAERWRAGKRVQLSAEWLLPPGSDCVWRAERAGQP
ncbi:hypothetical protein PUR43_23425, partial [Enterobacter hormaechei subsp. xiangfangensis]|nr:hypothetical protein [Enterobacter hormaechei subsp. xiangfangensis]